MSTPLGEMLRLYRAAHNLSVRDLAPRVGFSYPTLNRIERGAQMDLGNFLKLVSWLTSAEKESEK